MHSTWFKNHQRELKTSAKDRVEEYVADTQQGGSDILGVRLPFKSRDTGGTSLWSGDLGGHPPHGNGPGGDSDLVGETDDETAPAEGNIQDVDIHLVGDGKECGGFTDDGGIRHTVP